MNLFKSKAGLLVIDIHSHILPAVDDGAKSWEIAVEMCRIAADDGITHMVATPHANERFSYDRVQHENSLRDLQHRIGDSLNSAWAATSTSPMTACRRSLPLPSATPSMPRAICSLNSVISAFPRRSSIASRNWAI